MRKELALIEQIENYVMGKMRPTDKKAFESQIEASGELQANVAFQQELMEGIRRMGLKVNTQNAYKSYLLKKMILIGSAIAVTVAVIAVVTITVINSQSETPIDPEIEAMNSLAAAQDYPSIENKGKWPTFDFVISEHLQPTKKIIEAIIREETPLTNESPIALDASFEMVEEIKELTPIDLTTTNIYKSEAIRRTSVTGLEDNFRLDMEQIGDEGLLLIEYRSLREIPIYTERRSIPGTKFLGANLLPSKSLLKPKYRQRLMEVSMGEILRTTELTERYFKNAEDKQKKYRGLLMQENSIEQIRFDSFPEFETTAVTKRGGRRKKNNFIEGQRLTWSVQVVPIRENIVDIEFTVKQEGGVSVYSTEKKGSYNMETQFLFRSIAGEFDLVGNIRESGMINLPQEEDYNIEEEVKCTGNNGGQFIQRIEIKSDELVLLTNYAYMMHFYGAYTTPPKEDSTRIYIDMDHFKDKNEADFTEINAIIDGKFNNTNIASREFEERLPWIEKTCDPEVLEVYVNNLDKNLWQADLLAAALLEGELKEKFEAFAERKQGMISIEDGELAELQSYYETSKNKLIEAKASKEASTGAKKMIEDRLVYIESVQPDGDFVRNVEVEPVVMDKKMQLVAPDSFSPNGDGIDDVYTVRPIGTYTTFEISIKDKKGREVFFSTDQDFEWDGKDKQGKRLPAGLYKGLVYCVNTDNRAFEVKTEVTLKR